MSDALREAFIEHFGTGVLVLSALGSKYGNRILNAAILTVVVVHAFYYWDLYLELWAFLRPVVVGLLATGLALTAATLLVGYLTNRFAPNLPEELVR